MAEQKPIVDKQGSRVPLGDDDILIGARPQDIQLGVYGGNLDTLTTLSQALEVLDDLSAAEVSVSGLPAPLNAASTVEGALTTTASQLDSKVTKSGDTMTGFLTLHANPTSNLHASTKQYVDGKVRDQIVNGVTTSAPSENAVFDALALKQDAPAAGTKIKSGTVTFWPTTTVTFSSPTFSSTPVVTAIIQSNILGTNEALTIDSISSSSVTFRIFNGGANRTVHWIAVGT